jgi:hypothetical protein
MTRAGRQTHQIRFIFNNKFQCSCGLVGEKRGKLQVKLDHWLRFFPARRGCESCGMELSDTEKMSTVGGIPICAWTVDGELIVSSCPPMSCLF